MLRIALLVSVMVFISAHWRSQNGQTPMGGTITNRDQLHTPDRGSPERKAIMDALRLPIEKRLKQSVIFKIDHLKVQSGWAFLIGAPQRPDGTPVDYHGTVYQEALDEGAFDDSVIGLFHEVNGKWRVIQYIIGATDVPYIGWDKKYHAPAAIFEQH